MEFDRHYRYIYVDFIFFLLLLTGLYSRRQMYTQMNVEISPIDACLGDVPASCLHGTLNKRIVNGQRVRCRYYIHPHMYTIYICAYSVQRKLNNTFLCFGLLGLKSMTN